MPATFSPYQQGRADAATWADYINVGMEHGAFDMAGLDEYLRGLVAGGPTRSGHRTPTIVVEAPVEAVSEEIVRYSAWIFRQILGRGVHGILLCQAESLEAVRAFVESCRYPVNSVGVGSGLGPGRRGVGSESVAAHVWGVDRAAYLAAADPWPLNPDGELLLGLKIESRAALPRIEEILAVPGIGFAELGPGDLSMSLGYREVPDPWPDEMVRAHERVKAACRQNGVAYLDAATPETVAAKIDAGARDETAQVGRAHSGRQLPA